jgi:hypothetical protein
MVLTDYEVVFPHCSDVDEDGTAIFTPNGTVRDADYINALADDVLCADRDYGNVMRDLADYRCCVENQDESTVGELVSRVEKYRGALVDSITALLVSIKALARSRDITCGDIQLAVDKYAGLVGPRPDSHKD